MKDQKHVCDHKCFRVSEVIGQWPFGIDIDPEVLHAKTKVGINVHDAIAANFDCIPIPLLTPKEMGYFSSFLKWKENAKCEVIMSEKRFCDEGMRITGKMDLLAKFPYSDEQVLVDFKTSAIPSAKRWKLQAGLYYHIMRKNNLNPSKRVIFLQLDRLGGFPKIHEYEIDKNVLEVCFAAIRTFYYWHID